MSAADGGSGGGGGGSGGDGGGGGGGGGGGSSCNGDWTLGEVPFVDSSAGVGQACSPADVPRNCRDGAYIRFADGSCNCVLKCSSLVDSADGASCTSDGSWHCHHIQATNASANSAHYCVADAWNICRLDGAGASDAGVSSGGSDAGPRCASSGASCSGDSDCCSGSCDTFDNTCASGGGGGGGCGSSGSDCTFDSDCCSDSCGSDDTCA